MNKLFKNIEKKIWKTYTVGFCDKLGKNKSINVRIAFANLYNINLFEIEKCKDLDMSKSKNKRICLSRFYDLNDLFTRRRLNISIDTSATLISPADAKLSFYPNILSVNGLQIKSHTFDIADMLNNKDVELYKKSSIYIFYLSPKEYHRFHMPFTGKIINIEPISGDYYTVVPNIAKRRNTYGVNKRTILSFEDNRFRIILIGSTCVGSIAITVSIGETINIGDEIGYFAFGGSTIIILDSLNTDKYEKRSLDVRVGDKLL
jgi:phosphatidylserine decarboxylase